MICRYAIKTNVYKRLMSFNILMNTFKSKKTIYIISTKSNIHI